MNKAEYSKLAQCENTYWWHKGKLFLIQELVKKYFPERALCKTLNIFEVGCGTGEVNKKLESFGKVTGIDISKESIEHCTNKGIKNVYECDINNTDLKKITSNKKFDLIVALDVLEHIQDDIRTIKSVRSLLKENGYFFVTVPVHKFLWSEHDESLHHKRRYSSLEIIEKLKDSGFDIVKKSYFVSIMFPAIALFRIWNNFFQNLLIQNHRMFYCPIG